MNVMGCNEPYLQLCHRNKMAALVGDFNIFEYRCLWRDQL